MTFRRFATGLVTRLALIGVAMLAMAFIVPLEGYVVGKAITVGIIVSQVIELWRYVSRTNREISRFLEAARNADFSQRFSYESFGSGFDELGAELTKIINELRQRGVRHETEVRKLKALLEHIPTPLMTVHADHSIVLHNNAARRLFGSVQVTQLRDLRQFGTSFHDTVSESVPGERELVTFAVDGSEFQLTLAATEIVVAGQCERLISLQDIQSELDIVQAEAWQDLVSVLTHEMVNSIAPVTSLASSASEVVQVITDKVQRGESFAEELEDLRAAVSIVAKRSDSLTQFVDSYRQISRLAPPEKKRVSLGDLFADVARLSQAEDASKRGVSLTVDVRPPGLDVYADRDLIEPVLLNILRNARQATAQIDAPAIEMTAKLNKRGNVVVEISDNGPGVAVENAKKIFVPFFTTREGGSGVGLALARQVMIAHGGFIQVLGNRQGGALFRLTF